VRKRVRKAMIINRTKSTANQREQAHADQK